MVWSPSLSLIRFLIAALILLCHCACLQGGSKARFNNGKWHHALQLLLSRANDTNSSAKIKQQLRTVRSNSS
jgi:hypothetical protein